MQDPSHNTRAATPFSGPLDTKFPTFQDPLCKMIPEVTENGLKKYPYWKVPRFSFNSQNQPEEWTLFYTRALDFLEALDINPDEEDQGKRGWCQIKMMFDGGNCQAFKS